MLPKSEFPLLGLALRCDRRAPRLARSALDHVLDGASVLPDARLVVSELISAAVLNSVCEPDDILRVHAHIVGGVLILSVDWPLGAAHPASDDSSGDAANLRRRVVERVAQCWGTKGPDGHATWAALAAD